MPPLSFWVQNRPWKAMNVSDELNRELNAGVLLENLLVTDLTVEGRGIARYGRRVIFLDRGLPGETVRAVVTRTVKGVAHAEVLRRLSPSPHETAPWCPHFTECGACAWQHFAQPAALEWKADHVRQSLARIGKLAGLPVAPVLPSPLQREFRNKMSYAFADQGGETLLGLRRARDHALVAVTGCSLQPRVGMEVLAFVREAVNRLGLAALRKSAAPRPGARENRAGGYLRFLVLRIPAMLDSSGRPQLVVECISGPDHSAPAKANRSNAEAVALLGRELAGRFNCAFVHSERRDATDVAQGERTVQAVNGHSYQERFGHLVLTVPYAAFLQTNTQAAALLYDLVEREAALRQDDVLWDVYCGVGGAGLYAARGAGLVHGFELQAAAVSAARANAAALGYSHCFFHAGDVARTLEQADIPRPDVIIVDPPRAGLSERVRACLLRSRARRLLYVSCNVSTQARDAGALAPVWKAVKSFPVDMFPYTPHVENLLVFDRSGE